MRYLYLSIIIAIFSCPQLFAGAETINRDGKITFVYDEYQTEVDAYNARVSSRPALTNPYSKPSAFEVAVSTTMRGRGAFEKSSILTEIKKVKADIILLERLETDDGIDTSAEQAKLKTKLAGLKHIYGLAP